MKHTLEETLGNLSPSELDELLPSNFQSKISRNKLRRIEKITFEKLRIKQNKRGFNFRILVPVAVGLALCFGGVAAAAEALEYNAAMTFFSENNLSTEGLSRAEVKAVYRDISTQRFTNDKTAEVIRRSILGTEILQEEPTPEELSTLWNSNLSNKNLPQIGTEYRTDCEYKMDENLGFEVFHKSTVECICDGVSLWKNEFTEFHVDDCTAFSSGTAVWGFNDTWSGDQPTYSFIAQVDDNGEKLWERRLDHGFQHEYIGAVLDNGDGTLAVISRGDMEYLCFSLFDENGNEISSRKTEMGTKQILNAVRLGDGYMVQLGDIDKKAQIARLDKDGNITDNFVYEGEDCDYYITDMVEFAGRVYLSSYAVPKQQTDEGDRYEIAGIVDYYFKNKGIFPEELVTVVRNNYTAVLLLCDTNGGEPRCFYSVKGSLGGALNVEENQLKWDVESVVEAGFSPYTNSFSLYAKCRVYRYTFASSGMLVKCDKTDEFVTFRR